MALPNDVALPLALRRSAHMLTDSGQDFDPVLEWVGDARLVLIGDGSHETEEFYRKRAQITQRLMGEKGFRGVAAEADWPDAYRLNRFVRGRGTDQEAIEALSDFKRFPAWMWRNADVLDLVGWLRQYNDGLSSDAERAGFYGLDLYSLHSSIREVLQYLDRVDPEAARRARYRYNCFENFGEDTQAYGYAASFGLSKTCEDEVVGELVELQRRAADLASRDGRTDPDAFFYAEQNARLVKNAEQYYRSMFASRVYSWNLRDLHMTETLDALLHHLGRGAKLVVWVHNSHLGDARATEMEEVGELNVGQLVRERCGNDAVLIGFSTYTGTVTVSSEWDGPCQRKLVRPALPGSVESLFHQAGIGNFLLAFSNEELRLLLVEPRLERAIGVIYLPQSERVSHYFHARLPAQFDIVIHHDETRAVEPLERTAGWQAGELPETYPFAV